MTNTTKIMTVAIAAMSLATVGVFLGTNSSNDEGFNTFSWNSFQQERQLAGLIETANGYFAVPGFIATVEASSVVDEMFLTDEPGNWFKSTSLGGPLSIVNPGEAVEFDLQKETDSIHTVSLLVPAGKLLTIDQNRAMMIKSLFSLMNRESTYLPVRFIHTWQVS